MERKTWRLVRTPPMSGAWNMAIDEAMLVALKGGIVPPTLRLYYWNPPTVSLGHFQPTDWLSWDKCRSLGVEVVRRPSGGGAVLHEHEVTYAVVVPCDDIPNGHSVKGSYCILSQGIVQALKQMGVDVTLGGEGAGDERRMRQGANRQIGAIEAESTIRKNRGLDQPAFCFERVSAADLHVHRRKLVGSAQARRRGVLLQHGSIPLRFDLNKLTVLFGYQWEGISDSQLTLTWLERELRRSVSAEEVEAGLIAGFETALGVAMVEGELTEREWMIAHSLWNDKYIGLTQLATRQ